MDTILPLLILAIPIACIAWTVTHEELFREVNEYCVKRSEEDKSVLSRKFFYLFTCEYCFSHYVTIAVLIITRYTLLYEGWVGYFIAFFTLVFIANVYMSLFAKIKVETKKERIIVEEMEQGI